MNINWLFHSRRHSIQSSTKKVVPKIPTLTSSPHTKFHSEIHIIQVSFIFLAIFIHENRSVLVSKAHSIFIFFASNESVDAFSSSVCCFRRLHSTHTTAALISRLSAHPIREKNAKSCQRDSWLSRTLCGGGRRCHRCRRLDSHSPFTIRYLLMYTLNGTATVAHKTQPPRSSKWDKAEKNAKKKKCGAIGRFILR